jgi:uncharacterized protein (DUF885 family)
MRSTVFVMLLTLGCARPQLLVRDATRAQVNALADEYVRVYLAAHPEEADRDGWPGALHNRLSDRSPRGLAAWAQEVDRIFEAQRGIAEDALYGQPEWLTLGLLREALETERAARICRRELWAVDHLAGWQVALAELAAKQPMGPEEYRAEAFSRWRALPAFIDTEISNLREGQRRGYSAPKSVVQRVLDQLEPMTRADPASSPFYALALHEGDAAFRDAWRALVVGSITPAIVRYRDFLRREYLPAAREALGISHNPDGAACWRALFRGETSLDRPAEQTLHLGEERVASMTRDVLAIGEPVFGTASPVEIVQRAADDPRTRFANTDELLAFMRDAVERSRKAMPKVVVDAPAAAVEIEPYPAYSSEGASDGYEPASEDGRRPARYRMNLAVDVAAGRAQAEITAFHEAWPGHHLQIATAGSRNGVHPISRLVGTNAYIEGWARYAEQLADDLGLYTTVSARVLRRAWPGRGMVVDPGIHLFGWTRERALAFMEESGMPATVAEALVDRISVWPAQLTAYDTGALEIFALRDEAQKRLGDRFDVRRFDACVLATGPVPLRMLHRAVTACLFEPR